jgi:hypothetical protein
MYIVASSGLGHEVSVTRAIRFVIPNGAGDLTWTMTHNITQEDVNYVEALVIAHFEKGSLESLKARIKTAFCAFELNNPFIGIEWGGCGVGKC